MNRMKSLLLRLGVICILVFQLGCKDSTKSPAQRPLAGQADAQFGQADLQSRAADEQRLSTLFLELSRAGEFTKLEEVLRQAAVDRPRSIVTRRLLVRLYNAQGRRSEASEHAIELLRLGEFVTEEAMSLVDRSGPFTLVTDTELTGKDEVTLLDLGLARFEYSGEHQSAAKVLPTLLAIREKFPDNAAAAAFLARICMEQGDTEAFEAVVRSSPPSIDREPEFWQACGLWFQQHDQNKEALAAFFECLYLDPTNRQSLRALATCLDAENEPTLAAQLRVQVATLDEIFKRSLDADGAAAKRIASELMDLARPWEAWAWLMIAADLDNELFAQRDALLLRHRQITQWEKAGGRELCRKKLAKKWLGLERDSMQRVTPELTDQRGENVASLQKCTFTDVACDVGICTQFQSDFPVSGGLVGIFQTFGGGLGACDIDLDGAVDVYVAQAGLQPNVSDGSNPNEHFRQTDTGSFVEVGKQVGIADRCYAQGCCFGDINQDGWPDLVLANIGPNRIYINQGDGTYRRLVSIASDDSNSKWTSSIAVADLNGDHLPDIVEANYIDDDRVWTTFCELEDTTCVPQDFKAATHRFWRCQPDGTFSSWEPLSAIEPAYGFGIVVANFDGLRGNDVFIANDIGPNQFWSSVAGPSNTSQTWQLVESAAIRGCSIGYAGNSQACMGVASGDFNGDGTLDLHVTNFHRESVNLFLQNQDGFFSDLAVPYQLVKPSIELLGFGTQAADFNNDGQLDIAVMNGHVYDSRKKNTPYQMRSQLFLGTKGRFVEQDDWASGDYFQRQQIGRTLATLDFNRDGKMDLLSNHLDRPIALLKNETPQISDWVELALVGVVSERDATGAEVRIRQGQQSWTLFQTGGDGLMSSNEPILHASGLQGETIDLIEVHWPSGKISQFEGVPVGRHYQAIENEEALWSQ